MQNKKLRLVDTEACATPIASIAEKLNFITGEENKKLKEDINDELLRLLKILNEHK